MFVVTTRMLTSALAHIIKKKVMTAALAFTLDLIKIVKNQIFSRTGKKNSFLDMQGKLSRR